MNRTSYWDFPTQVEALSLQHELIGHDGVVSRKIGSKKNPVSFLESKIKSMVQYYGGM